MLQNDSSWFNSAQVCTVGLSNENRNRNVNMTRRTCLGLRYRVVYLLHDAQTTSHCQQLRRPLTSLPSDGMQKHATQRSKKTSFPMLCPLTMWAGSFGMVHATVHHSLTQWCRSPPVVLCTVTECTGTKERSRIDNCRLRIRLLELLKRNSNATAATSLLLVLCVVPPQNNTT